jgi:hypothetical protein
MSLMRTAAHQRVSGGHVPMPGEVAGTTGCACWRHCRSVGVTSVRCRSAGMKNTSMSVRRVRKEPACVARRMERIDASLDDLTEGLSMMPPWSLPSLRADGMARPATLTTADVQVSIAGRARDHRHAYHPPVRALGVRGGDDRRYGQSRQHRSGDSQLHAGMPSRGWAGRAGVAEVATPVLSSR